MTHVRSIAEQLMAERAVERVKERSARTVRLAAQMVVLETLAAKGRRR